MKKIISIVVLILLCQLTIVDCFGQSINRKVISTAGGTLMGGGNQLDFTIGETAVTTLSAANHQLTQGFEQPDDQVLAGTVLCNGSKIVDLETIEGVNKKWYLTLTGGTALSSTTLLTTRTYYFSQTIDGAEGVRNAVAVSIIPKSVAGSVSGATGAICYNTGKTLTLSSTHKGAIVWQSSSIPTGQFEDIADQTGNILDTGNLVASAYFRAKVTNGVCPSITTGIVKVTVNSESVSGFITAGNIAVCPTKNSSKMILNSYLGKIQWQKSSDNINFINIPNATYASYTANNLLESTYYRVVVRNGGASCASDISESVVLTVKPAVNTGRISGSETVCYNNRANLTVIGSDPDSNFKWKYSQNQTGPYYNSTNATATSDIFMSGNLTYSLYYKVLVTNEGCSAFTEPFFVKVQNAVAGSVSGGTVSPTVICVDTPSLLTLNGFKGTEIQWYSSVSTTGFVPVSEATSNTYELLNSSVGRMYYRASVAYPGCSLKFTPIVNVTVAECSTAKFLGNENDFSVKLYPNPFIDGFKMEWNTANNELLEISVFDMTGRLIDKRQIKPHNVTEISLGENYSSGVYNVIVSHEENSKVYRVVKK